MRRSLRAASPSRRGMVLLIAVLVVAMLSLGALTVSRRMTLEYRRALQRGDQIQSVALVQSGIETIVAVVAGEETSPRVVSDGFNPFLDAAASSPITAAGFREASLLSQGVYHHPGLFAGVAVAPPVPGQTTRGIGRFTVLAPRIASERLVGVRYGLVNESAKLSLLTVLRWEEETPGAGVAALLKLPSMTPRFAESLLDWIDADKTPRRSGAEIDQYEQLGLSYGPRNDIPVSIDELLLIHGADREAIFGSDPELCFGYRRNGAWLSVAETLPLAYLLTAHAAEKLVTPEGEAKTWINNSNLAFLRSELLRSLDTASVDFVIAYREKYGAAIHPLDLLGATLTLADGKTLTSPFLLDRAEDERRFFALLDAATESRTVVVRGRVNILEAPASVLAAIPFLTGDQVREIVARRGDGATREPMRRHPVWLLSQGIVDAATMRRLWDVVTCGGDVYSAQVIGFFDDAPLIASRADVVVDSTVKPPRVVFAKEMSGVRHAYPPSVLRGTTSTW